MKEDKINNKNTKINEIDEKHKETFITQTNTNIIQEQRVWTQTPEKTEKLPEKNQNQEVFTEKKEEKPLISNNITKDTPFGPRKMFNFNQKKVTENLNEKEITNNFNTNFEKPSAKSQENKILPEKMFKKTEPAKKNIFDSENENFFNIREIKEIHDKSTRIYENSGLENSNEISNNNNNLYNTNKEHKNNDDNTNTNNNEKIDKKPEDKKKQFKIKQDKKESGLLNYEGKNTFFDDFDLN